MRTGTGYILSRLYMIFMDDLCPLYISRKMETRCFPYLDKLFTEVVNLQPGRDKNEEKGFFPRIYIKALNWGKKINRCFIIAY